MKRIYYSLSLLFCLLIGEQSFSQTNVYYPFPDSGAKWSERFDYCLGCDPGGSSNYENYAFGSYFRETHDTIINALTYHLINYAQTYISTSYVENNINQGYYSHNFGPPFSESNVGAIREDSLHRIYYRSFQIINYGNNFFQSTLPTDSDILLYDFSLSAGQASPTKMYGGDSTFVIKVTDSVQMIISYRSGLEIEDTVHYFGTTYSGYDTWVDGIGSATFGLLGTTYPNIVIGEGYGAPISLTCFSINDTVLFPPYETGSCDTVIPTGINILPFQKSYLQIFPNPTSDELFLTFSPGYNIKQISIYNYLGQMVYKSPYGYLGNTKQTIDVSNFSAGLYFVKAMSDEGVLTSKFVKE